jgi:DNA-binding MarR family transcriptional regulator
MPRPPRRARPDTPAPAAAPPPDPRHVAAAERLHSAAIHLLRRLRREDAASGLTAPRLSALSVLVFGGPLSLGALAAAEQVRPPTMTRLVAALERLGLATRVPDAADGRVVLVQATARGRRLLDAGRARRVAALAARIAALPPDARDAVVAALDPIETLAGP